MTAPAITLTSNFAYRQAERKRWTAHYETRLQNQLIRATHDVQSGEHPPAEIIQHLNTFLTTLHRARRYPAMHEHALSLIAALHPWPVKWGHWDTWIAEIRFAVQTATQLGKFDLQAEFQAYLAQLLFQMGKYQQAVNTAKQAIAVAREQGEIKSLIAATETNINALRAVGLPQQADEELQELENVALKMKGQKRSLTWREAELAALIGWLRTSPAYEKESRKYALSTINQAIALFKTSPHIELSTLANMYTRRGIIHWRQDEYPEAVQSTQKALELYTQDGDIFSQAVLSGNLGTIYWGMGKLIEAEKALHQSITITEALNAYWDLTKSIRILAAVYLARGQPQRALHYNKRHLELATELNEPREIAGAISNRGVIKFFLNEVDTARHDLETGLALIGEATHIGIGCSYVNLSRCYAALGQREYTLELVHKAEELAEINNSPRLRIIVLRCLAEYLTAEKDRKLLNKALALAKKHNRLLDQAACLLTIAKLTDNVPEKNALWEQGVNLLEQMGAKDWLQGHSIEHPPRLPMSV